MAKMPNGFKPVRGKSVTIKLQPPKPAAPKTPKPAAPKTPKPAAPKTPKPGIAPPVTPGKLARAPEADDVLITTPRGRAMAARMGNPNIIRTTVNERPTPTKKGK